MKIEDHLLHAQLFHILITSEDFMKKEKEDQIMTIAQVLHERAREERKNGKYKALEMLKRKLDKYIEFM